MVYNVAQPLLSDRTYKPRSNTMIPPSLSSFFEVHKTKFMTTIFNVVCESIHPIQGKEKTIYKKVGYLKATEAGGYYLHLFHQPGVTYRVFNSTEDNLPIIK